MRSVDVRPHLSRRGRQVDGRGSRSGWNPRFDRVPGHRGHRRHARPHSKAGSGAGESGSESPGRRKAAGTRRVRRRLPVAMVRTVPTRWHGRRGCRSRSRISFKAIDELAPVAGSGIRRYPALAINPEQPGPHPWLGAVRERLEKHGFASRTVDTGCEQGFGTTDAILIATRG